MCVILSVFILCFLPIFGEIKIRPILKTGLQPPEFISYYLFRIYVNFTISLFLVYNVIRFKATNQGIVSISSKCLEMFIPDVYGTKKTGPKHRRRRFLERITVETARRKLFIEIILRPSFLTYLLT